MSERERMPFKFGSSVWPGLSKLIEECGEVIQVAGKLLGTGGQVQHWDGTNLHDRLTDELADVLAAAAFVCRRNGLSQQDIDRTAKRLYDAMCLGEGERDTAYMLDSCQWAGLGQLVKACARVIEGCARLVIIDQEKIPQKLMDAALFLELSELSASIMFVGYRNGLSRERLDTRVSYKLGRFEGWHEDGEPPLPTPVLS